MQKQRKPENNTAAIQAGFWFYYSSAGTKTLPRWKTDGNFRLSIRFLEHGLLISAPTNQKKIIDPAAFTSNFAYKSLPENHWDLRGFEHNPLLSFLGPTIKSSLL